MTDQIVTAIRRDDSVPEPEAIEESLYDVNDNTLEPKIKVEERLLPGDVIGSAMAEQPCFAVQDDDSIPEPEAVEQRLHSIEHANAHESDINRKPLHTEQDTILEDDPVETDASTDSTVAPGATAERRIVELPVELHEHIIGFLDNWDVQTIAHCALVCRRWVPFSRFKLYHCIRLNYRWQWTAFEHLISPSTSSNLMKYLGMVQQLRIEPQDEKFFDKEGKQPRIGWQKGQERGWTHLVLVRLALHLPVLTHIEFWRIDWSEHYQVLSLCSGSTWHSLATLELDHCRFTGVAQLHMFVTAFPALADLTLRNIDFRSTKTSHIPKGGHPLTRLKLAGTRDVMAAVTRWLAGAKLVQKLVGLNWRPLDSVDHLKTLTEAIDGPSLENLELPYVPRRWPGDLSRFASLKVLKLHYVAWSRQRHFESVNDVLSSISSDQLEELDISLSHWYRAASSLDKTLAVFAQLKAADDLLAGSRFAHLRRVVLKYDYLRIYAQVVPNNSSSGGSIVPVSGSSSHPDPSDQLVSTQHVDSLQVGLRDPQHPFKIYAEHLVRRKIRDEMKQLDARGILDVVVTVDLRDKESNTDAGSDEDITMDGDSKRNQGAKSRPEHSAAVSTQSL